MSARYASQQYGYSAASQPINMPQKQSSQYYSQYPQNAYSRAAGSPPELAESVTSSSGVTSYDPSAASSSYAGSTADYESTSSGGSSIDMLEYMNDRMASTYNPIPLDRSLAQQAQVSGQMNAKTRRLMELRALAESRLAAAKPVFEQGLRDAKQVQSDLRWTQDQVNSLNRRAARKYPKEYAAARDRYPDVFDY